MPACVVEAANRLKVRRPFGERCRPGSRTGDWLAGDRRGSAAHRFRARPGMLQHTPAFLSSVCLSARQIRRGRMRPSRGRWVWSVGTRERNAENVNDQGFRIRRVQLLHRPLRRGLVTPDQFKTGERHSSRYRPAQTGQRCRCSGRGREKQRPAQSWHKRQKQRRDRDQNSDCRKSLELVSCSPEVYGCWSSYHCIAFVLIIG